MATLKGLWVWNTSVNFTNSYSFLGLSYTSNNTTFNTLSVDVINGNTSIKYSDAPVYNNGWGEDAYRTIDFGTTEQECPDEFYTEFTSNAKSESSGGDTPSTPDPDEPDNPDTPETTPTEDSVKAKIQSLITKANTTTGKSDADLTKAVLSLVAGYGQGGTGGSCNLNHIIEVEELPTEGIVQTNLYKMDGTYYQHKNEIKDLIVVDGGESISYVELASQEGVNLNLLSVDDYENVSNPTPYMDQITMTITLYYDTSRDDVFAYMNGTWGPFSLMEELPNGGSITDASEATTDGYYYALVDNGWKPLGAAEYTGEVVIK